jgi:hypothetical protein
MEFQVDECPDCEDKINPYPDIQLKVVAKVPEGRPAPPTPATSGNAPSLQPYFVLPYSTGEVDVKNYTETKVSKIYVVASFIKAGFLYKQKFRVLSVLQCFHAGGLNAWKSWKTLNFCFCPGNFLKSPGISK